uniref:NADH-ubiquinone oxidoreductase chain 6 n=1 Tax=Argynnis hyperbius TaxID=405014 RepID=G3F3Y3_9NEOP|nr:NADH dehydrogenase subunit 6 [Argynnis hyperbius]ADZ53475.1 NADH dehydrogenase subunit 6 [Argynnis hyperbius]
MKNITIYFINFYFYFYILFKSSTIYSINNSYSNLINMHMSGMLINTYWFSYILFLIFLGGLLVLFIYVSSIASNELFKISSLNKMLFSLTILYIIIISIYFKNNLNFLNFYFNDEMMNFFNLLLFTNNEYNFNLMKLYNEQTYFLMMMMIIYLFITLIAVVKITNIFFGPLRSYN